MNLTNLILVLATLSFFSCRERDGSALAASGPGVTGGTENLKVNAFTFNCSVTGIENYDKIKPVQLTFNETNFTQSQGNNLFQVSIMPLTMDQQRYQVKLMVLGQKEDLFLQSEASALTAGDLNQVQLSAKLRLKKNGITEDLVMNLVTVSCQAKI